MNNDVDTINLEISKGTDINVQAEQTGSTALLMAIRRGHLESVELLVSKGAMLDIPDKRDIVPLRAVALRIVSEKPGSDKWNRYFDILSILIDNGADIDATNDKGETAFHYVENKPPEIKKPIMSLVNGHKAKQKLNSQAGNSHSVFHTKTELRHRHTAGNTSESSASNHNSYDAWPPNSVNMDERATEESSLLVSSGRFSSSGQIGGKLCLNLTPPKSEGNGGCTVM